MVFPLVRPFLVQIAPFVLAGMPLLACKKGEKTSAPPPEVAAVVSSMAQVEAAPPPGAAPLALSDELRQFAGVDACRESHQERDRVLGDALDALGYEVLLDDACQALLALKESDANRCAALRSSTLRQRCVRDVAILRKEPTLCPTRDEHDPRAGHDPLCLALAQGSYVSCTGFSLYADRTACEATSANDPSRCEVLGKLETARCKRLVARFAGVAATSTPSMPPRSRGSILLVPEQEGPTDPDAGTEIAESSEGREGHTDPLLAMAGAVEVVRGGRRELVLGTLRQNGIPTTYVPPAGGRLRVGLVLLDKDGSSGEKDGAKKVQIAGMELEIPGRTTYVVESLDGKFASGTRFVGQATVTPYPKAVGDKFRVHLDGVIGVAPQAFRFSVEVETWLRDRVSL